MTPSRPRSRAQIAQRLQRASGTLSTAATTQMEADLPWVNELPAEDRAYIGLIVQAGIKSFVDWFRRDTTERGLRAEVFGVAPPTLASEISLQQTVALVRLSIEVVEANVANVVGEDDAPLVHEALNRYAREMAFATAEVYARAAEQRGAWDARLEALVVDAVLRGDADDAVASRASALGWDGSGNVVVVVGGLDDGSTIEQVRRIADDRGLDCLCSVQGERLVVILGGVDRLARPAAAFADAFAAGQVVIGPVVEQLADASRSAEAALSGLRVAHGWAEAPRPVLAQDLLVERALAGDTDARDELVASVWEPLSAAGGHVLETLEAYLASGRSLEATGRLLFIHPNTVRYRLRRVAELTGLAPTDARESYSLQVALTLGRLRGDEP